MPDSWKSKRQRILEIYFEEGKSVPKTVLKIGYKSPSFVREVVQEWRKFLREQENQRQIQRAVK